MKFDLVCTLGMMAGTAAFGGEAAGADLPASWRLASKELVVDIFRDGGRVDVRDLRTGRSWVAAANLTSGKQLPPWKAVKVTRRQESALGLEYQDAETQARYSTDFRLKGAELVVGFAGSGEMRGDIVFPRPFETRKTDCLILPASEGFRLPFGEEYRANWTAPSYCDPAAWGAHLCMPFFGVEDGGDASGYMVILETPNDARMRTFYTADGRLEAVAPGWAPERGRFGYARRARYVFFKDGGYVAMAKRYRADAQREGLVKTFAEKVKTRPIVDRLLGAASVWYFPASGDPKALQVARELKAAGIERFMWTWNHGGDPETVRAIGSMPNVLVGRYDCYRDVYRPELFPKLWGTRKPPPPEDEISLNTSAWPEDVVWDRPDDPNSWRKSYGFFDRTGTNVLYCTAQCDLKVPARARRTVTRDLKAVPYTHRMIDVVASLAWEECENPAHPMTRTQSRAAKYGLLAMLGDEFGLVVGSEQGMGAVVPVCDYFLGMLSPHFCRMPHGRPGAGRPEIFRDPFVPKTATPREMEIMMRYGVGEKYRIPLFELVFHECCCSQWYWYDYSNRPLCLWKKRDLFNALYGTAPMYIFDYLHWTEHKAKFQESYALVSPVARRTGYSEMLDHRALTPDRTVQQSRFADGTVVTVNFGERPFTCADGRELAPLSAVVTSVKGPGR